MTQSQMFLAAENPFVAAELDYRREVINRLYRKHPSRHRARRLRWLTLPKGRRRPIAVA
jgi:hypothetical protein